MRLSSRDERRGGKRDFRLAAAVLLWAAAAAYGVAAVAIGRPVLDIRLSVSEPRGIVIVAFDALRADHVSCYGYPRHTTPNIDAVAADGVTFERAYTNGNWTKPSISSLFTGLWASECGTLTQLTRPEDAGVRIESVLSPKVRTLAEVLTERGYACGGFVRNAHLDGALGFGRGFEIYRQGEMDCDELVRQFLAWRGGLGEGRKFFTYVHIVEPHAPYEPREPFKSEFAPGVNNAPVVPENAGYGVWGTFRDGVNKGKTMLSKAQIGELRDLYDADIAWSDEALGTLVAGLKARGDYDETLLVLLADHGENFAEHGYVAHPAWTLFEEQIRIPMVIKFPKSWGIPVRRVSEPVEMMDVTATVAAAAGGRLGRGDDLAGYVAGGAMPERMIVTQSVSGFAVGMGGLKAVFSTEGGTVAMTGLYNVLVDPETRVNVMEKRPSFCDRLTARAAKWYKFVSERGRADAGQGVMTDDERLRQLKALGYVQ
jgi:arylsulfatase